MVSRAAIWLSRHGLRRAAWEQERGSSNHEGQGGRRASSGAGFSRRDVNILIVHAVIVPSVSLCASAGTPEPARGERSYGSGVYGGNLSGS